VPSKGITRKQLETLGKLSDKAANLRAASHLRLPPEMHVTQLSNGMKEIRDEIRELYIDIAHENPWDLEPKSSRL
jgi:hypothetical protein